MIYKKKLAQTLARGIGRCILKSDIHPVLYFAVLFLCLAQTALSLLPPDCMLFALLQWFDLSLHVDSKVLLCILAAPCLAAAGLLLLQNYWAADSERMETTIAQHYAIKIAVTLAFVMSYTLCLTQVRCAVAMIRSPLPGDQALGAIVLTCFLAVVYPYSMFLLTDLSPQNHKIYAFVNFPNCFTFLNIYRPIAALLVSTNNFHYVIIPTSILSLVLIVGLLKHPIITWQYNKLSQSVIASVIWIILIRILELVSRSEISGLVSLVGFPIFVFFAQWLTHRRLIAIISKEQNTVLKLKTLYFLMVNRKQSQSYLSIFLIEHYRACNSIVCSCQSIFQVLRKQKIINQQFSRSEGVNSLANAGASKIGEKSTFSLMNKLKQSTNEKEELKVDHSEKLSSEREKEGVLWFSLMNDLQNDRYDVGNLRSLPTTEKNGIVSKAKQIVMDEVEVLHYQLDKQYQSLKCVWYNDELEINNFLSLFYLVRHLIEVFKQEQTLQKKSKQDGLNQYALNYHALQTQLIHFKGLLYKTTTQVQSFWVELASQKPDQKKLLKTLEEIIKGRQQISAERKKVFNKVSSDKNDGGKNDEHSWDVKTRVVLEEAFLQFSTALKLNSQTDPYAMNQKELKMLTDNKERTLEKNLELYDYKATTGMAVVNIKPGAQFGLISLSNKSFWELVGCQKYEQANVSHFFIKEMQEYHNNKMLGFLQQNKHTLTLRRGFIVNGCKEILEIEIAAQLLPHLSEGLFVAVFVQEVKSARAIFLLDSSSKILAFNRKFKENFLQRRRLADYDEVITKEVLSRLQDHKESRASLEGEQIHFKLCQTIHATKTTQQTLFYCEILQQSIFSPTKSTVLSPKADLIFTPKIKGSPVKFESQNQNTKLNSSQKKRLENNKKIEENDELRRLYEDLANEKSSKMIQKWRVFINVLLTLILALSISCAATSHFKANTYVSSQFAESNLSKIIQHTAEALYLSREANILGFHNITERLPRIKERLGVLKNLITNERIFLGCENWNQTIVSYQIDQDGALHASFNTLDIILQNHLLPSLTNFIEESDHWGFNYTEDTAPGPFLECFLSFKMMTHNSYYAILPTLKNQFRKFVNSIQSSLIRKIIAIIPLFSIQIILGGVIITAVLLFRALIIRLNDEGFILFSKFQPSILSQRLERISVYLESHLYEYKKQTNLGRIESDDPPEIGEKSTKDKFNISQDSTIRDLELTNRSDFEASNQSQIKQITKLRLKWEKAGNLKTYLKIVLKSVPLILVGLVIVVYQKKQNIVIEKLLLQQEQNNRQMQNIFLINTYSFEFMFESPYFDKQALPIYNLLQLTLTNAYDVMHQIRDSKSPSEILDQNDLSSFCSIVSQVCSKTQCRSCDQSEAQLYKSKSMSQVLVAFIETARSLTLTYNNISSSAQERQVFATDVRHEQLSRMSEHLISVQSFNTQTFHSQFLSALDIYLTTIILICLIALPIVVMIVSWSLAWEFLQMQKGVRKTKLVFQLISFNEILKNQAIKNTLLQKQALFQMAV